MSRDGEIIIIEDDHDERSFLKDIFESLGYPNEVVFFEDSTLVIPYLSKSNLCPFIIISDIYMPKLDGFELRRQILAHSTINIKFIPYIFLSASNNPENVEKAYSCNAQGYFRKGDHFLTYRLMIQNIIEYWLKSLPPLSSR